MDRREKRKRALISQEAAEWFARMKSPRVPLDERRRFLRWLKQSEIHVAEYLALASIDGDLRQARLTAALDDSAANVVELFAHTRQLADASRDAPLFRWRVAAAIAVCVLGALLFAAVYSAWYQHSLGTAPAEWKTVALADGSKVQLGPNTLLQVELDAERRLVVLKRGEAYFKVAKDPARPFLVEANAFAVRAVGTEFAVSRRKSELIITVAEGVVRVAPSVRPARDAAVDISPELSVPIMAHQQLRIGDTWPATPTQVDVRYELAWSERQLTFRPGDTLGDAVEEFNLRNRVQLRLDPRAAALPVRGSFDASDPVAFARIMSRTAPIAIERHSDELLLLKKKQ